MLLDRTDRFRNNKGKRIDQLILLSCNLNTRVPWLAMLILALDHRLSRATPTAAGLDINWSSVASSRRRVPLSRNLEL